MAESYYVVAAAIAITIIIWWWYTQLPCARESLAQPAARIISEFTRNQKNGEGLREFRRAIGDPAFRAYHYAQLLTLYRARELTPANVAQIVSK
jgi:hypothetical protein